MMLSRRIKRLPIPVIAATALILVSVAVVAAVSNLDLFELDGDAADGIAAGDDWDTLYGGGGSAAQFVFVQDGDSVQRHPGLPIDETWFDMGGSKDVNDIPEWRHDDGDVSPDKDEILNAFAAAYVYAGPDTENADNGDLIVYFGADRFAVNGDSQIGFWFMQDDVGPNPLPDQTFTGEHQVGDVLVLSDFLKGGGEPNISVYEWVASGGEISEHLHLLDSGAGCVGSPEVCAEVNSVDTAAPWPYQTKSNKYDEKIYPPGALYEGGINLTQLLGDDIGCFSTFLAETRSSQSEDAQLKDFALGAFSLCEINVVKTGDTLSKVGDDVEYEITITNDGVIPLYKQSIVDDLLGDLTDGTNPLIDSSDCGASLAPDESCTIELTRTVQEGDPDPLPNTVTVVYDSSPGLVGDEVSSSDDHSVNLFQPSITMEKTGDELSKIGDTVDYVITLNNTSSDDTPTLSCTVTDATVGVNESFDLAPGESEVINVNDFVIPGDADDPFLNTAYGSCSPDGFPNVLDAEAGHSVNLFQPSITIDKDGDTLSKKGDPVDYTITVENTSSADTPTLSCTLTDATVGVNQSFDLDPGESEVVNINDFIIPDDASDPFDNTANVVCSPDGFSNVLDESDDHSVNLFQPSITLDKSGSELSKIGDPVDYVITLNNTSSADTPTLSCTVTDATVGVNHSFDINPGESEVINVNGFIIPDDASDPFNNTASATCSPAGFGNVLEASDGHSVNLFQPSITFDKDGDTLSKIGDPVDYVLTLNNTSSADTPTLSCTVMDATVGVNAAFDLNPGESEVINVNGFIIPDDADDPFLNTASASCSPAGFGNVLEASDGHSVNLFQPSITLDKDGDTLSKIGDPVDYVITLENTSSDDTPTLSCTVTDATIGVNESFDIDPGESEVINVNGFIIPDDADDPFPNTAEATCSPAGFENVLEAADGHSVNLFQPSITFDKDGDTLSKIGDPVDYVITLNNTSSDDTPTLSCTVTDGVVGVDHSFDIDPGESEVINVNDFIIPDDASDPFNNTASVVCSPAGFDNVLDGSDGHSINLFQPSITLDKVGDELSKIGDPVDYMITLSNTSSGDTPTLSCTVTDATVGVNAAFNLNPGESEVINVNDFIIPDDADDPFLNTAYATCSPDGFGNVLDASDGHSVNLFQPSVSVDKTGDELGKVTDPVDYVITLSNNSSADTPPLTCVAIDSLLGEVFNGVLPPGDTVLNESRVVQEGDPDPLVNEVGMTCTVEGFPNILTGSDSHTTELFQPDVEVIKTGPATATRGDTITYDYTINNLSSADSPDLILDSVVDDVVGDLTAIAAAAGCDVLVSPGGTCNFSADYTIAFDDPSPLVNVVTVHYHPEGFPNDIDDDDDHEVLIPVMGCTPGFWQGGAGSQQWNDVNDPDWTGAGTNPYIHTTLFNDFFNVTTDPRLDGLTMYDLVSSGGTSDSARRAARDMVAAYLNQTAFPEDFPADSLAALVDMWYNAVAGGDAALDAFHNLVSGWNNPEPPGFCPLP